MAARQAGHVEGLHQPRPCSAELARLSGCPATTKDAGSVTVTALSVALFLLFLLTKCPLGLHGLAAVITASIIHFYLTNLDQIEVEGSTCCVAPSEFSKDFIKQGMVWCSPVWYGCILKRTHGIVVVGSPSLVRGWTNGGMDSWRGGTMK